MDDQKTKTLLSAAVMLLIGPIIPQARADVTLTTLVSFTGANGSNPFAGLVQGSDGNFYGTTFTGGTIDGGTVFRVSPEGALETLHSFTTRSEGYLPACGLARGTDDNFYGTTGFFGAQGHGIVFQIAADGSFSVVGPVPATVSFVSSDGRNSVVHGSDGNLYITAGALPCYNDFGSISQMALDGSYSILYSFSGGADGYEPSYAGLVEGIDGNFYGATTHGGAYGHGTIFNLTPTGTLTTLVAFTGTDGAALGDGPFALLQAKDQNLYGTTTQGGAYDHGTVFKMSPDGTLTTLVSFDGTNGDWVQALIQAKDDSFYGTTSGGGQANHGTIFQVSSNGALTSLISFNGTNGDLPVGLMQGSDGYLYGTTIYGGQESNNGTVFRITPAPPQILTATKSGSTFKLSWTSMVGRTYQLQITTNLAVGASAWTTLTGLFTATNTTSTASDTIGPDGQRFYRVVLSP